MISRAFYEFMKLMQWPISEWEDRQNLEEKLLADRIDDLTSEELHWLYMATKGIRLRAIPEGLDTDDIIGARDYIELHWRPEAGLWGEFGTIMDLMRRLTWPAHEFEAAEDLKEKIASGNAEDLILSEVRRLRSVLQEPDKHGFQITGAADMKIWKVTRDFLDTTFEKLKKLDSDKRKSKKPSESLTEQET